MQNKVFFTFVGLIFFGLIYLLAPILTPFLVGTLLAYLVNPFVTRLMRLHIPRLACVVIVFIALLTFMILLILLLIPLIQGQIGKLTLFIPKIIDWFQLKLLPMLATYVGTPEFIDSGMIKTTIAEYWTKAGSYAGIFLMTVLHSGARIFEWIMNLIIIPVVTFYLLRDWQQLLKGLRELIPRHIEPIVVKLSKQCDNVLSAFFRGQLLVMLGIAIYYSIGLSVIGLDIGVILGLITGLISIVPYLGVVVGVSSASIAAFVQFGEFKSVLLVWALFAIGQLLDSLFLTPNLVGDRIGLHPVIVIFAVLAGGSLFGFFGVLLALPTAAVIMVCLRFLEQRYQKSHLYR